MEKLGKTRKKPPWEIHGPPYLWQPASGICSWAMNHGISTGLLTAQMLPGQTLGSGGLLHLAGNQSYFSGPLSPKSACFYLVFCVWGTWCISMKTYFPGNFLACSVWGVLSDKLWQFAGLALLQQGMASFQSTVNDSTGVTYTSLLIIVQKKQMTQNNLFNNRENVNLTGFRSILNVVRHWQL